MGPSEKGSESTELLRSVKISHIEKSVVVYVVITSSDFPKI